MIPAKSEARIQEFVRRGREAMGANLESVVLYGSAANGEFHEEHSDLNLLCVVRDSSFAALEPLRKVISWWRGEKSAMPMIMTRGELEHATDVFSIELLDMKQNRRVLFGDDFIGALEIPMNLHRVQVEYELREKTLLLRQRALLAGNEQQLRELLTQSVTSFSTLCRHALIALGKAAPVSRRESITQLAAVAGFDPSALLLALDLREKDSKPKDSETKDLFGKYLAAVEKITAAVDEALG